MDLGSLRYTRNIAYNNNKRYIMSPYIIFMDATTVGGLLAH